MKAIFLERILGYSLRPLKTTHATTDHPATHTGGEPADPKEMSSALEPHYSVQVLAELWRLDESTIRRIFEDVPGVLKLGNEKRRSGKREYYTLRIPASVAAREYERRLIAANKKGA